MSDITFSNTGYFTSDNEPGRIKNATHNTKGGKAGMPEIYRLHVQVYIPMYCGLHFLFRRAHYHS
jgi:hypothetical protein